jgi:putative DNA primase/helicase
MTAGGARAVLTLEDLAVAPVWVAWRYEDRDGKPTKVPFAPNGAYAKADDPVTWGSRRAAEARARRIIDGLGGGIGVILGIDCGDGTALGGIDLDACRSPEGDFDRWAIEITERFGSYAEVSPSGTGAKVFFRYRAEDLPRLREIMGTATGKKFARRTGNDHPPAIEIYLSRRYFAVTGDPLDGSSELRLIDFADLEWISTDSGPAFVGCSNADAAFGSRSGDGSRSGAAFRLGMRMRRG